MGDDLAPDATLSLRGDAATAFASQDLGLDDGYVRRAAAALDQEFHDRLGKAILGAMRADYRYLDVVTPHSAALATSFEPDEAPTLSLSVAFVPANHEWDWGGVDALVERYDLASADYDEVLGFVPDMGDAEERMLDG